MIELLTEKQSLWEHLKQTDKPIFIYGMGDGALKIIHVLEQLGIPFEGIYASNNFVRGHSFCGYKVLRLDEVTAMHGKNFISLLAFATFRPEMLEVLYALQDECEFYAPDVPVVKTDDEVFDHAYIQKHNEQFTKVYNMLADDWSKKVMIDTLNFKVSGKIDYLKGITTNISEVYEIIKPTGHEHYVDLGAYNGDTVSEFLRYSNGSIEQIYAFEPDVKNFKRLHKRIDEEKITNINTFNIGAWSEKTVLHFSGKGGRNSKLENTGVIEVQANSVDHILQGKKATTIKFDVEGAEYQALLGCKETIQAYAPKLMVSSYHKNEDLYALPLLIHELNPNYKFYLRHHPYIPCWETNYYCVVK
ncbi:FkbM family methyltransferase [Paludicola sp. MB14-C6]|uniref:FkbM family methyltransferase n=1 Tax=Paludihabitans sp. MB14-C6 TaxID=3070656 RepID=UPI0027DB9CA3|nr:FkbM family methyltransferase [Paludicola sp. MB14-C6]WMJ21957.1 FkbM family methyltransferase [Paludicola sp. MB14-C6]